MVEHGSTDVRVIATVRVETTTPGVLFRFPETTCTHATAVLTIQRSKTSATYLVHGMAAGSFCSGHFLVLFRVTDEVQLQLST